MIAMFTFYHRKWESVSLQIYVDKAIYDQANTALVSRSHQKCVSLKTGVEFRISNENNKALNENI